VSGSPVPLLAALAHEEVVALRTREESLEEVFLSYYDRAPHDTP